MSAAASGSGGQNAVRHEYEDPDTVLAPRNLAFLAHHSLALLALLTYTPSYRRRLVTRWFAFATLLSHIGLVAVELVYSPPFGRSVGTYRRT